MEEGWQITNTECTCEQHMHYRKYFQQWRSTLRRDGPNERVAGALLYFNERSRQSEARRSRLAEFSLMRAPAADCDGNIAIEAWLSAKLFCLQGEELISEMLTNGASAVTGCSDSYYHDECQQMMTASYFVQ